MSSELKRTLCNMLIEKKIVKPYQVIVHSYTNNRIGGGYERYDSFIDISPTLHTRCDIFGVVVPWKPK